MLLDDVATDVMLSVARGLKDKASARKSDDDAMAQFRQMTEKADAELTALLAELDAQED
jgi:hypothetical protein